MTRRSDQLGPNESITFELKTATGAHRITWRAGRITLHDHKLSTEQALRALGAPGCPCLLILDAFSGRTARWAFDAPHLVQEREAFEGVMTDAELQRLPLAERNDIVIQAGCRLLKHLVPAPIYDAMRQAHRVRSVRRDILSPLARMDLAELMHTVATPILKQLVQDHLADIWPHATISIECWLGKQGRGQPVIGHLRPSAGFLVALLAPSWLNRVYRRGAAVVDGAFILDVDRPAPATLLTAQVLHLVQGMDGCLVPEVRPCVLRRERGVWVSDQDLRETGRGL